MLGSFLTRGLVLVFGYAYPAYECYKTVELNKPEIEQLRFWCQYWILVAMLTVSERIGDAFVSWVPMYSEAKLAFFIYLWYPKTKGSTYVYESFFRPYIAEHENEIDRNLLELRTRAGDMAIVYWQRAASYGQTRLFDILQFVAAQSTPRPRAQQQQGPRARQVSTPPTRQPSNARNHPPATSNLEIEEPPSPTSSTSSSQHQMKAGDDEVGSAGAVAQNSPRAPNASKAVNAPKRSLSAPSVQPNPCAQNKAEVMQIEASPSSSSNGKATSPAPTETIMEEAIRATRGRLRKTRSGTK
ncbi:HVA22-like protein i [Linum grandiflorum]